MNAQHSLRYDYHFETFVKRAAQGAAVGLVLMVIFMYADNLLYSKRWTFGFREYFPMITIAVGGALAGVFSYLTTPLRHQGGWVKYAAIIATVLVFVFALWISAVAGFAVTGDWD